MEGLCIPQSWDIELCAFRGVQGHVGHRNSFIFAPLKGGALNYCIRTSDRAWVAGPKEPAL